MDFLNDNLHEASKYAMLLLNNYYSYHTGDYYDAMRQKANKIASFFDDGTLADLWYMNTADIALYYDAGWHFSSMLDDKGMLKKMRGAADFDPSNVIENYAT